MFLTAEYRVFPATNGLSDVKRVEGLVSAGLAGDDKRLGSAAVGGETGQLIHFCACGVLCKCGYE